MDHHARAQRDRAELLARIAFLAEASGVPSAHHESWYGSGYPLGMQADAIPLHARIFAVVDSYDAIRSERPYEPARSHGDAVEELGESA